MLTNKLADILKNKGISINNKGEQPTNGFMVSTKDVYLKSKVLTRELLLSYWKTNKVKLETIDNLYLGVWYDVNEGFWYIGLSLNIMDKKEALEVARENKQLAIYDINENISIYLK